jgi:serine protease Do
VANTKPGSKATLEVLRNGKRDQIAVTLGELKPESAAQAQPEQGERGGKLGLAVRPLSPEERKQLDGQQGLVVQQVSGPAARAGIRPGDLITMVNGTPVKSVDDLRRAADKAKGTVAVLVKRGEASLFVPIEIG